MNKYVKQIKEGIIDQNPIFVQFLGMCSALAVTTSIVNALGMGLSFTVVLIFSNLFISLLRKFIPSQVRIAAFIVIISGFVTAVELVIKAYLPAINESLGLFIPLIVVNCIILARAESFASKNAPLPSIVDGIAMGAGYTFALVCISVVRELIGKGQLFGLQILGSWYKPAGIFILPAGAFLTLGFLVALFRYLRTRAEKKAEQKAYEALLEGTKTVCEDGDVDFEVEAAEAGAAVVTDAKEDENNG